VTALGGRGRKPPKSSARLRSLCLASVDSVDAGARWPVKFRASTLMGSLSSRIPPIGIYWPTFELGLVPANAAAACLKMRLAESDSRTRGNDIV
jgi:hypothetical protein